MVIPKIGIINVQLVKDTFATRKHYHLKLSTHKFIILNFQLLKKLSTRKIKFLNFQPVKHNLQQKNYLNFQLVKSISQLTKATCNS